MIAAVDIALFAILWAGIAAGLVHVVTGVDHMAALLPLSVGRKWRASLLGVRWGVGHSLGVVLIALIAVELRQWLGDAMELDSIGEWAERLVGVMLIVIGCFGIRSALRSHLHSHAHEHDGQAHEHLHVHGADGHVEASPSPGHAHAHTAFFAGVLHGLAGTGHVLAVLPAVAMNNRGQSWAYLGAFGVGTICAMAGFAGVVGISSERLGRRGPGILRNLMLGAACLCILVGIAWILLPTLGYELP